jgi:hypothetical protein
MGEVSHVSGYDDEEFAVAAAALGHLDAVNDVDSVRLIDRDVLEGIQADRA